MRDFAFLQRKSTRKTSLFPSVSQTTRGMTPQAATSLPAFAASPEEQTAITRATRYGHSINRFTILPEMDKVGKPHAESAASSHTVSERAPLQLQRQNRVADAVDKSRQENSTGLPDALKVAVEGLSGYSLSDVQVHYNSSEPAKVDALAYTQGTQIHVGPGQEQHLAHEAWHVVQQKQGRVQPTIQAKNVMINNDQVLEKEADRMGASASHHFQHTASERSTEMQQNQYTFLSPVSTQNSALYPMQRKLRTLSGYDTYNHKQDDELKKIARSRSDIISKQVEMLHKLQSGGGSITTKEKEEKGAKYVEYQLSSGSNTTSPETIVSAIINEQDVTVTITPGAVASNANGTESSGIIVNMQDGSNAVELGHELIHAVHFIGKKDSKATLEERSAEDNKPYNYISDGKNLTTSIEEARTVGLGEYHPSQQNKENGTTENHLRPLAGIKERKSYEDISFDPMSKEGKAFLQENEQLWQELKQNLAGNPELAKALENFTPTKNANIYEQASIEATESQEPKWTFDLEEFKKTYPPKNTKMKSSVTVTAASKEQAVVKVARLLLQYYGKDLLKPGSEAFSALANVAHQG